MIDLVIWIKFVVIGGAEDIDKEVKNGHIDLPVLDVSVAFPQATPASIFPPSGRFVDFSYFIGELMRLFILLVRISNSKLN